MALVTSAAQRRVLRRGVRALLLAFYAALSTAVGVDALTHSNDDVRTLLTIAAVDDADDGADVDVK